MDDDLIPDFHTTEQTSTPSSSSTVPTSAFEHQKERPEIQLPPGQGERRLTLPTGKYPKKPEPLNFASSPPDSPHRSRAYTMGSCGRDNAAVTPPSTPTTPSHSRNGSLNFLSPSPSVRKGDATSAAYATVTRPRRDTSTSVEEHDKSEAGSTTLMRFTFWLSDYEIETQENGKKKPIGSGVWSDVFLAKPCLPKTGVADHQSSGIQSMVTPPITPVRTRNSSLSSLSKEKLPQIPPRYAIKVPASRSAKTVLGEEARILSCLSRLPDAEKHIVPFYGQDSRTEALVLKAMDGTLEAWIQNELNTHNEAARARELSRVFPGLAIRLIDGLLWMQGKGCTHADVKPSNVLVSSVPSSGTSTDGSDPSLPQTVYSDFSSSILCIPQNATPTLPSLTLSDADSNASTPKPAPTAPLGGGTWDYLDPQLLRKASTPTTPSNTTDLWSLAITLLFMVIGTSPYDSFRGNKFQQREMIKQGAPLSCLAHGDDGPRNLTRIKGLAEALGWDVLGWFGKVLKRDVDGRVGIEEWRREIVGVFEGTMVGGGAKI